MKKRTLIHPLIVSIVWSFFASAPQTFALKLYSNWADSKDSLGSAVSAYGGTLIIGVPHEDFLQEKTIYFGSQPITYQYEDPNQNLGLVHTVYGAMYDDFGDSAIVPDENSGLKSLGSAITIGSFRGVSVDTVIGCPDSDGGGAVIIDSSQSSGYSYLNIGNVPQVAAEELDYQFGRAVATGDFNNDGYDDLAVGIPGYGSSSADCYDAGAVAIFYGDPEKTINKSATQFWTQNSSTIEGTTEDGDQFGFALATGDFNHDGYEDLAIGVPGEDPNDDIKDSGAVNVIYGSASGLSSANDQLWSQDSSNIEGYSEDDDQFGFALATGDFNHDGYEDLAIGVPGENPNDDIKDSGAVNVIYGSASRLTSANDQIWSQDSSNIEGYSEDGDQFGFSLVTGDFNGDLYDDLAIGVPGEEPNDDIEDSGAVNVIYGSASRLTSANDQIWSQDSPDISGVSENNDLFGYSLAAADFDYDGTTDLAVGAPGEAVDDNTVVGAGIVHIILGGKGTGLVSQENRAFTQYFE